jgi:hypothetical protein
MSDTTRFHSDLKHGGRFGVRRVSLEDTIVDARRNETFESARALIIRRAENGWIVTPYEPESFGFTTPVRVAEKAGRLLDIVNLWASAQIEGPV